MGVWDSVVDEVLTTELKSKGTVRKDDLIKLMMNKYNLDLKNATHVIESYTKECWG